MNKDQMKGAAKEAEGKIQKGFGDLVDSPKHQAEGAMKEVAGKIQKGVGDVKEDIKDESRRTR
jgi:uncharacterized protein YjbJ (UPF0337 family)